MERNISEYYKITENYNAHKNVTDFLSLNVLPSNAIDLGCGAGRDTIALIKKGWNVLAIDKEDTEEIIRKHLTDEEQKKMKFLNAKFGGMDIPKTKLIVANYSLSFSKRELFNEIWKKIDDSIIKGGYFVGTLFGKNDSWAKGKNDMTFFDNNNINEMFKEFKIIKYEEIEKDKKTALGQDKHWHIFDITAIKR